MPGEGLPELGGRAVGKQQVHPSLGTEPLLKLFEGKEHRRGRNLRGLERKTSEVRVVGDCGHPCAQRFYAVFLPGKGGVLGKSRGLFHPHHQAVTEPEPEPRGQRLAHHRIAGLQFLAFPTGGERPKPRVDAQHLDLVEPGGGVRTGGAAAQHQDGGDVGCYLRGKSGPKHALPADQG